MLWGAGVVALSRGAGVVTLSRDAGVVTLLQGAGVVRLPQSTGVVGWRINMWDVSRSRSRQAGEL